jgi:hypothetical protein
MLAKRIFTGASNTVTRPRQGKGRRPFVHEILLGTSPSIPIPISVSLLEPALKQSTYPVFSFLLLPGEWALLFVERRVCDLETCHGGNGDV